MRIHRRLALALALLAACGCGRHQSASLLGLQNQPPVITLTGGAAGSAAAGLSGYQLTWNAYDPDGRVERVEVSNDLRVLASRDAAWRVAGGASERLSLRSRRVGGDAESARGELTVFAARAVDNRGAVSAPAIRAFFGDNVAPMVQIVSPVPSSQYRVYLPPSFRIQWDGSDPDGPEGEPTGYAYRVFSEDDPEFPVELILASPDSLMRRYSPDFPGWTNVPGDSTTATITGLERDREYVFAVVAFDEHGAYTPFFSRNVNLLYLRVEFVDTGPRFHVVSRFFEYGYGSSGGYELHNPRPTTSSSIYEYPSELPLHVRWEAFALQYSTLTGYRWVLDPDSLDHPDAGRGRRPRSRWTHWSLAETTATIGPFHGHEVSKEHHLVLEAADDMGRVTRLDVRLQPVRMTFQQPLLVVNDTRFPAVTQPVGPWPNVAEFDTFLFARGGVPWAGMPAGTMSSPGIFAGYAFDTLGTRTGREDLTVPLDVMSRYRQVVWIVDPASATNYGEGTDPVRPKGALRYMCGPERVNTLAAYLGGGGRVWFVGSSGYASLYARDKVNNNIPLGPTFSFANGELVPGTMMYDLSHWRSEFRATQVTPSPVLLPGVSSALPPAGFPARLTLRKNGTEPLPPGRTASQFFLTSAPGEFLTLANEIREAARARRGCASEAAVLDTFYRVLGPGAATPVPCMTRYYGHENGEVVQSGFDLWSWRRPDCVALVDGVLGGMWGMTKEVPAVATAAQVGREPAVRLPRSR